VAIRTLRELQEKHPNERGVGEWLSFMCIEISEIHKAKAEFNKVINVYGKVNTLASQLYIFCVAEAHLAKGDVDRTIDLLRLNRDRKWNVFVSFGKWLRLKDNIDISAKFNKILLDNQAWKSSTFLPNCSIDDKM
jgi:hypothetical protein